MSDDISAVTELLDQAKRLGLLPSYRYGTVVSASLTNASIAMVTLDGDDEVSRVYNLAGFLYAGVRVFTVSVAPHGVYAIAAIRGDTTPVKTTITSGSGTQTFDASVLYAYVEVLGGGGGGGGVGATVAGQSASAGGGAGGGYASKIFSASELVNGVAYSVGTGGTAAPAGNNPGGAGVATTFGVLSGAGGGGGTGMASTVGPAVAAGGTPGTSTGGTLNIFGGFGNNGFVAGGNLVQQGFGGSGAVYGSIIRGVASAVGGTPGGGLAPGGGSAGAHNFAGQAARAGGAGADGIIVITSYFA